MLLTLAKPFTYFKSSSTYLKQFKQDPKSVGSIIPSSSFLCSKMILSANWSKATRIAELGAGNGVLTHHILKHLSTEGSLDAYEIEPTFIKKLHDIADQRLQVLAESAANLDQEYDIIFSCLPLLSFPSSLRMKILKKAKQCLAPQGQFVQFQYTPLLEPCLTRYFNWKRSFVLKNIPPAFVYTCTLR